MVLLIKNASVVLKLKSGFGLVTLSKSGGLFCTLT